VLAGVRRSWASGEPWEDIFPLRGLDGNYRWFLTRALPIRDGNGRILRWFGTNTDVTEQRIAQEKIAESERWFRTMADKAPVMIWMAGPDKQCT
jgi:PAS domain-containing protein